MSDESPSPDSIPVTRAELVAHLASGDPLDLSTRDRTGRTIAGSLLREVLIDKDLHRDPRGLNVTGAWIPDDLDLSFCTVFAPLRLRGAEIKGVLAFQRATILGLLDLAQAELNGKNESGDALAADGLLVNGNAILSNMKVGTGAVRLSRATITGSLDLSGAELNGKNHNGDALVADVLRVDGGAYLTRMKVADGALRLSRATITGSLRLTDAELNGMNSRGDALAAHDLRVDGDAFLGALKVVEGAVRLSGATITGQLHLTKAELNGKNSEGNALVGDELRVDGDALLDQMKVGGGAVRLVAATIKGALKLYGTELGGRSNHGDALMANRVQVSGTTFLHEMKVSEGARISLRYGRLGNLFLDEHLSRSGWHRHSFLGLRYDQIHGGPARNAVQGARLLASQADSPRAAQPYWQLAEYYAGVGNDSAARRIRVWSNVLQARVRPGSWPRYFYGLTTGFGYYPFLALLWLALLIGLDAVAVDSHRSDFIPTKDVTVSVFAAKDQEPVNSVDCDSRYPCFSPLLYATDTVVPVISLGQQDAWRIDTSRAGTGLQVTLLATKGAGWILTTLLVGGVGGLLRRT